MTVESGSSDTRQYPGLSRKSSSCPLSSIGCGCASLSPLSSELFDVCATAPIISAAKRTLHEPTIDISCWSPSLFYPPFLSSFSPAVVIPFLILSRGFPTGDDKQYKTHPTSSAPRDDNKVVGKAIVRLTIQPPRLLHVRSRGTTIVCPKI